MAINNDKPPDQALEQLSKVEELMQCVVTVIGHYEGYIGRLASDRRLKKSERRAHKKMLDVLRMLRDEIVGHKRLPPEKRVNSLEIIDYLRLVIGSLEHDCEATRRENGYLRKMLEETSGEA